jgi:hypothetical protein
MRRARNRCAGSALHLKRAQEKLSVQRSALRKYNSTIRFIGFPPSARLIIDKSANLDAFSI